MGIFDRFRSRGRIVGRIVVSELPPHLKLSVSVAILEVGKIPQFPDQYGDVVVVKEFEEPAEKPLEFSVSRRASDYFIAVNLMALFQREQKLVAQTEWLFPMEDPIRVTARGEHFVEIPVVWPSIPQEEIQDLGTVHPDGRFTPPATNA